MVDSSDCFSQHETDVNGFDFGTTFFGNTMEDCVGYQHLCVVGWVGGGWGEMSLLGCTYSVSSLSI